MRIPAMDLWPQVCRRIPVEKKMRDLDDAFVHFAGILDKLRIVNRCRI